MNNKSIVIHSLTLLVLLISCEKKQDFDYPLIYTGDVKNISDTSALFTAKISSLGNYPILESGFIWGVHSNDNYGIKLKYEGDIINVFSLKTNVALLPEKTYYVRAYVKTESSVSYGREVNFQSPKGQINRGSWTQLYSDNMYSQSQTITTSFTIDGVTFFVLYSDGSLYSYTHATNTFNYVLTDPILYETFFSVVHSNKAFVFSGDAFYSFNPQTKSFTKQAVLDVPNVLFNMSGFIIDDNIYVGAGTRSNNHYSRDFWKYNITENIWKQAASFSGADRIGCFSFSFSKTGYVGGGFSFIGQGPYHSFNDLWCYLPETNEWIQKEPFPIAKMEYYGPNGTNTSKFGYCLFKNNFFEYNPTFDVWEQMASPEVVYDYRSPYIFSLDNSVFILDAIEWNNKMFFELWEYEN